MANAVEVVENITQNCDFISSSEKEIISMVLDSIKDEYKTIVFFEFERQSLFDIKRPTKAILLARLQNIIIDIADKKSVNARIDKKDKFLTSYEENHLKRLYFIARIIDVNNSFISYFIQDLKAKALD